MRHEHVNNQLPIKKKTKEFLKGFLKGLIKFWNTNKAATLTYIILNLKESEQHESGYDLEMKFCDLSLILWEQVPFRKHMNIYTDTMMWRFFYLYSIS